MDVNGARMARRVGALMAWVAAVFYAVMALGIAYPDLGVQRALFGVAAIAYAAGGAIMWRGYDRRVFTFGAIANVAVIVVWAVRVGTGGAPADGFAIASKVVELALGVILLVLLLSARPVPGARDAGPVIR